MMSLIHFTIETDVVVNFSQVKYVHTILNSLGIDVKLIEYYKIAYGDNFPRRRLKSKSLL